MQAHPNNEYRMHKTISGDADEFRPGAAIAQAGVIYTVIPVASAGRMRLRFKATVGGTLAAAFLSPGVIAGTYTRFGDALDGTDAVAITGSPNDVTITANIESVLEITDLCGEVYLLVSFTEADVAAGVVTYANYCQL